MSRADRPRARTLQAAHSGAHQATVLEVDDPIGDVEDFVVVGYHHKRGTLLIRLLAEQPNSAPSRTPIPVC